MARPPSPHEPTLSLTPDSPDGTTTHDHDAATAPAAGGSGGGLGPTGDWMRTLAGLTPAGDDPVRIDQIRALEDIEDIKAGCAAAQARITAVFAASQRASRVVDDEPGVDGDWVDRDVLRAGTPPGAGRAPPASTTAKRCPRNATTSAPPPAGPPVSAQTAASSSPPPPDTPTPASPPT